jgi:transposase
MFVRRKPNKSGTFSVQVVSKVTGKYKVLRSFGASKDEVTLLGFEKQADMAIIELKRQSSLSFSPSYDKVLTDFFLQSEIGLKQVGPELVLGPIFDEIGFNEVKYKIFRHLVIGRVCFPGSKLKTARYLFRNMGLAYDVSRIYRFMDKLDDELQLVVEGISIKHTKRVLGKDVCIVFYDVTTIYFEASEPDEWRIAGFSKDGKHQNPQLLLGLLVSEGGYPLAYSLFEGNQFEGTTIIPVLKSFKERLELEQITVVADAGLLSKDNMEEMEKLGYSFILGARLKNEPKATKQKILELSKLENAPAELERNDGKRLIVSFSKSRQKKDAHNRERGLEKLRKAIKSEKLSKAQINQRGYNRFLALEGEVKVTINEEKITEDSKWDGLKGYISNTKLTKEEIITYYNQLWAIEKAFRISKTDLRVRPVHHRLKSRIKAHICISFCAYKLYKEFERQLKLKQLEISVEMAIELLPGILEMSITLPDSGKVVKRIMPTGEHQTKLIGLFNQKP